MKIAAKHVDEEGKVHCPCINCVNYFRQVLTTVYAHIHDRGFLQSYTVWTYHGEKCAPSDLGNYSTPRVNTQQLMRCVTRKALSGVLIEQDWIRKRSKES